MLPEIKRSHASQVSSLPSRRLVCLTISPGMMSPAPASSLITLSLSSPRRDGFPVVLPRATPGTVAAPPRRAPPSTDRRAVWAAPAFRPRSLLPPPPAPPRLLRAGPCSLRPAARFVKHRLSAHGLYSPCHPRATPMGAEKIPHNQSISRLDRHIR